MISNIGKVILLWFIFIVVSMFWHELYVYGVVALIGGIYIKSRVVVFDKKDVVKIREEEEYFDYN